MADITKEQVVEFIGNMTVLENVMIGRHSRLDAGILGAVLRDPKTRAEEQRVVDDSYRILEKIGLQDLVNEFAKNLAYAAQRRLEIARALATEPFLLLLDEPAAERGDRPSDIEVLDQLFRELNGGAAGLHPLARRLCLQDIDVDGRQRRIRAATETNDRTRFCSFEHTSAHVADTD